MLKYLSILFFALLISSEVKATAGCIDAARTKIYTSKQPGQNYYRTSTFQSASAGCLYVYTGAICSIGSNGANNGYLGDTSNAQQCPIDDYVWMMTAILGGVGYVVIRRNTMSSPVG